MKNLFLVTIFVLLQGFLFATDAFPGTALEFDGVDDFVNCGNDSSLDITDSITIEAWINANSWKINYWEGTIVGKDGNTAGYNLRCGENGRLSFTNGISGSWEEALSSQIMNTGTWYHVAGVYDGVSQKIYINGELVAENATTGSIGVNTNNLQIGDSPGYPGRLFDGKIEEIRLWSTARTVEEIRENINLPLSGSETGIVSYWQFNEGTGIFLNDIISGNDGTLTNMYDTDWVNSTIPFGSGSVNTQIVGTTGVVDFTGTDLSMDIIEKTGIDTIVVSKLDLAPNIVPINAEDVFDSQYWVVRKYGAGTYNSNTTFKISEDLTIEDENKPNTICLFSRDIGSDNNWYVETISDSVSSVSKQSIFNDVYNTGQYILARKINQHIEEFYPQDDELHMILNENLVIKFDQEMIVGSGNIYIKKGLDDTIFETITVTSTVILDSLVTIDPSDNLEYFTDYYVLIDSTAFMNTDSVCFNGIYEKETWNFKSENQFTDINAELEGVRFSSVAWGDYDNDGDLDILLTGSTGLGNISVIYNNDEGIFFDDTNARLEEVHKSSVAWGDHNNDGDLDILLTGWDNSYDPISRIYWNGYGAFWDMHIVFLYDVYDSSVAWGDYDNDGDLDFLLTGRGEFSFRSTLVSNIYRNDSGDFININAGLERVYTSSVAWGDYDNDGDLDMLLTGQDRRNDPISKIYRNDSGVFTDINAGLVGVYWSSVAWGDYDNDGDLDILLTGYTGTGRISNIYRNDVGVFTDINAELEGVYTSSVAWGDYDNDGDLDILLTGNGELSDHSSYNVSNIYRNDSGVFTDINAGLVGIIDGSVAWGDYDNDGDLDILLTGYYYDGTNHYISKIYRNNSVIKNTAPSFPLNLSTSLTDSTVIFSWDKATDTETPQDGLSYNLYLGTVDNKDSINSSMSDIPTGYRKVVSLGNTNQNNSWVIKDLEDGTYYWSVQAVDHAFAGSEFSAEQTFSILGSPQNVITDVNGNDIHLIWDEVPTATSYKIYASTDPYGTFTDFTNFGTLNGLSWDLSWSGDKLFFYVITVSGTKVITKSIKSNKTVIKSK